MAEPFGIVAGAVGIAAAFTACVDCFEYIQLGRHFGRDYQTDLLSLNCARLRLTRWGQAVNHLVNHHAATENIRPPNPNWPRVHHEMGGSCGLDDPDHNQIKQC